MKKSVRFGAPVGIALAVAGVAGMAPAHAASESTWDALAQCESGGNWGINTGNGFSGGLQFTDQTWAAYGGSGAASSASKAEQIRVAENVLAGQGWGAWPACSASLGLYGSGEVASPSTVSTQSTAVEEVVEQAPVTEVETPSEAPSEAPVADSTVEAPVEAVQAPVAEPVVVEAAPDANVQSGTTYVVQAGDTLSEIAIYKLGFSSWQDFYEMNKDVVGSNPDIIEIGQVLRVA